MSTDVSTLPISKNVLPFLRLALSHVRVAEKRFEDSLSLLVCDEGGGRGKEKAREGDRETGGGGGGGERGRGRGESLLSRLLSVRAGMVHMRMEQYDVATKKLQKCLREILEIPSEGNGLGDDEMTWQDLMALSAVDHICSFFELFDDYFIEEYALKLLWRWDLVTEEMTWASESIKGVCDDSFPSRLSPSHS
jgi:hypothetical protein